MSAMQPMGTAMFPNLRQSFILAMPKAKQSDNNSISYSCEQQKILWDNSLPMTIIFCKPKRKRYDNELLAFLNCDSRNAISSCHSKMREEFEECEADEEYDEDADEDYLEADEDYETEEQYDEDELDEIVEDSEGNLYILTPVEEEEEEE